MRIKGSERDDRERGRVNEETERVCEREGRRVQRGAGHREKMSEYERRTEQRREDNDNRLA